MKTGLFRIFLLTATLILSNSSLAQTDVEGEVSGIWDIEGSPYNAIGEITVVDADTLIIQAGVEVNLSENIRFFIFGHLSVQGNIEDSVRFQPDDEQENWGGIRMLDANECLLDYCVITGGRAADGEGEIDSLSSGGNIFIAGGAVTISNSRISDGWAGSLGGGIAAWRSSPEITDCIISENVSGFVGGGIGVIYGSSPSVRNCEFTLNNNSLGGGALFIGNESAPEFTNCNFISNHTSGDGGDGGACYIGSGSDPQFEHCSFIMNESVDAGGAVYVRGEGADAVFDHCSFIGNTITAGDYSGGAMFIRDGAAVEVMYCQFSDNVSDRGGAIYVRGNPLVDIHHNLFKSNGVRIGGAVTISHDNPDQPLEIKNCTFVDQYYTGLNPVPVTVFTRGSSRVTITSSIIQDEAPRFPDETVRITYSHILDGFEGEGNSGDDPRFLSADTGYMLLRGDSPCIDSGDPNLPLDFDNTRNDRGWLYFPNDAMDGFQLETVTALLTTIERDTVTIRFRNRTPVPLVVTPMEFWTESTPETLLNVSELTEDFEIHGAAYVGDEIYLSGGNNGDDPNLIYQLDREFNLLSQYNQPGDRGDEGYIDLGSDGEAVIYGGNDRQVVEFTTDGEVGDPYDAPDQLNYITGLSADFSNAHDDVDFYLCDDDNIIFRADGNMWIRDSMIVEEPIRGLGNRINTRGLYTITEPDAGNNWLNLMFLDNQVTKSLYPLSISEGYQFGGFEITQNWEEGFGTIIGIMKGEEENEDLLFIERIYSSWLVIIPDSKLLLPNEPAEWRIVFAGDQMPAGRYETNFFMKINGVGEGNEILAEMDLRQSSIDEQVEASPNSYGLNELYPNPFNSVTKFWYSIPNRDQVKIVLTDASGRVIRQLVDQEQLPGKYLVSLSANNLPSGEYFVQMNTTTASYVRSAVLIR